MTFDLIQVLQIIFMPAFTILIATIVIDKYNKRKARKQDARSLSLALDDSSIRNGKMPKNWKDEIQNSRDDA